MDRTRSLHFRPIHPDDWHRLQLFHRRLSEGSVHLRFHGAKRELSTPLAHRFTDLDGHDNVAIVATTGTRGRIVGVARYFRVGPSAAEAAFVVEDEFQGRGVGRRLIQHLIAEAQKNSISELIADVLPGNEPMLRLLQGAGPIQTRYVDGILEVRLALTGLETAPRM